AHRLANARRLVSGVELRFADPMTALTVQPEVKRRLDGPYRIIDWKELNHNLFMALTMQKVIISLLLVLIIVVAAFNIIASLTMIVLSKVREIAILKSMGAPAGMVARVFLIGGTTVGVVGTGLGICFGLLICVLARLYGYPLDPKVYLIGSLPVRIAWARSCSSPPPPWESASWRPSTRPGARAACARWTGCDIPRASAPRPAAAGRGSAAAAAHSCPPRTSR